MFKQAPKFLRHKDWQTPCPDCQQMVRLVQIDKRDQRKFRLTCVCGKDIIIQLDRVPKRKP